MAHREVWQKRPRRGPLWPLAAVLVMGLGVWGFALLPAGQAGAPQTLPRGPVEFVYHTLRLFTLELDVPAGTRVPWQLWVAAFAAPVLTLGGIAALFREQLRGALTQHVVRPRLVIFGANDRGTAVLSAVQRPGRWRDAVVVVDPAPRALAAVSGSRVWTVVGDGASAASLRRAAVPTAASLVVCTGDNVRNSAITMAVLSLDPPPALEVYVEIGEPGLARTLEQGGRRAGVEIIPFSATALAAAAVLDELEAERRRASLPPLLAAGSDGAAPALALFGTGAMVDAMVLELHRHRQIQLLDERAAAGPAPRVVLFGPDASRRRQSLATLVGTELHLLDIDALDAPLDQVVELDVETARHLSRNRPLRQVFVLVPSDLDGGGIALTLTRHLGRATQVVLVTENGSTPFGNEIERQSASSATQAPVRLFRVPEHAYSLRALESERVADRLARALHGTETPREGGPDWRALSAQEREGYCERARARLQGAGAVPLRRSALVAPRLPEIPLLEALGFDRPTALARAGLGIDFQSVPVLLAAGQRLLAADEDAAFAAWCEIARLHSDIEALAGLAPEGSGGTVRAVRDLLLLRRTLLGDADAGMALAAAGRQDMGRREPARGRAAILLAGPDDDLEASLALLGSALATPRDDTELWAVAPPGPLRQELISRGVRVVDGTPESTRRQALAIWRALATPGRDAGAVRVVALPQAVAEEILLHRALGATIGRIEAAGAPDLGRLLLNGATGIVPLPYDRMTVRAFLRPGQWPAALAAAREPIAIELHRRYVARQRARKPADDPALQPWPALSPWLQRSNLALVDDIPSKLAAVGLRLDPLERVPSASCSAEIPELAVLREQVELLAELEHGRFTVERLLSGWTSGVREPARFLSPHLVPWRDLDEEAKEYDREMIRDIPEVLAGQGLGVRAVRR